MRAWKKMSFGLKVAVAATVVLALSIVGVLAVERFDSADQDDAVTARETDGDTNNAGDDAKPASKPLELGTVAKISPNYRIAVTEVSRYEVPTGQVIVPTIKATYVGTEDGEPWADLNVEFYGSGSRSYGESDCPAGLGHTDASEQPVLESGDEETHQVCIEVPTKGIKGGMVLVEEAFSTDDRTFWSTTEAVTKTLPSPVPSPASPAAGAPAARPRAGGQEANTRSMCDNEDWEEYDEDLEERKEWVDEQDERVQASGDEDAIEDWEEDRDEFYEEYEEWKDAYDCD